MTLPGFNAETSLYKTSVHYRLMGALVQADGVIPNCSPVGRAIRTTRGHACGIADFVFPGSGARSGVVSGLSLVFRRPALLPIARC
jgi:hypothetical protein